MPLYSALLAREHRRWWWYADDIGLLVGALGGSSAVLGFYDSRQGVTASSGTVAQWDDARGATGFGPSLTQATSTKQPAWDNTAKTLTFDGVDDALGSAAVALFDLSTDKSLIVVGAGISGNSGKLAIITNPTASRYLGVLLASTGTNYAPQYGDSAGRYTATFATVAAGTTPHLIATGKTTTSMVADIPNAATVTRTPTGLCESENAALVLGDRRTGTPGEPCACVLRAVIALNHQYTVSELAAVTAWAVATHSAVRA